MEAIELGAGVAEALENVSPKVKTGVLQAHAALRRLGIPHALCGGLAVAAHGYLRATKNVCFLTGEEVFERTGAILSHRTGVPVFVGDVRVDYVPSVPGVKLSEILRVDELVAVPVEVLIQMKLIAGRPQDRLDVVELVNAGADPVEVEAYLQRVQPALVRKLRNLLERGR